MATQGFRTQVAINSLLECSICMEAFKDPRNLSCGHTFCLKCLNQHVEKADNNTQVNCFICRQVTSFPEHDVRNLPKNYIAESFASTLSSTSVCALQESGEMHERVEYFCVVCWKPLCDSCARVHMKH